MSGGSRDSQYQPPSGSTSAWARSSQQSARTRSVLVAGPRTAPRRRRPTSSAAPHSAPQTRRCCAGLLERRLRLGRTQRHGVADGVGVRDRRSYDVVLRPCAAAREALDRERRDVHERCLARAPGRARSRPRREPAGSRGRRSRSRTGTASAGPLADQGVVVGGRPRRSPSSRRRCRRRSSAGARRSATATTFSSQSGSRGAVEAGRLRRIRPCRTAGPDPRRGSRSWS